MSKSLKIALTSTVLGVVTIAVGLYILSQTPKPKPANTSAGSFIVIPQINKKNNSSKPQQASDVPKGPIARGSERWCDKMLNTANNQWRDADAKLFAKKCIYN